MNWLLIGDLHLTDKAADAYRFGIFNWIEKQQAQHQTEHTIILGDLTERKDRHSSTLTNKIVDGLSLISPPVIILRGNHDGLDPENPFFKFVNHIDGVLFFLKPTVVELGNTPAVVIPHCRTQEEFNDACPLIKKHDVVLAHNTFDGAIAESGAHLSGLSMAPLAAKKPGRVWAGDVHRPQTQGIVTYVGAPYTVRFGDDFTPRCLLVKNGKERNLYFPCLRKWSLTVNDPSDILDNEELYKGDQIKLTIQLVREEAVAWKQHKANILAACKEKGLEVFGADVNLVGAVKKRDFIERAGQSDPAEAVRDFCNRENLPTKTREAGSEMVNDKGE